MRIQTLAVLGGPPGHSSDSSAEAHRNRGRFASPNVSSQPAFSSPPHAGRPESRRAAGGLPAPSFPVRETFAPPQASFTRAGPLPEHEKRRGMLAHAAPFVFRTTDRLGVRYSASAPPARRIASVTMPTLVTPAPLAASITSMISP